MDANLHIPDDIVEEVQVAALAEFEGLSRVYRPSFQTRAIADYIKNRVKELDPSIVVNEDNYRSSLIDDANREDLSSGNLWFDLPANLPALKDNEPIILQAHMDMVCTYVDEEAHQQLQQNGVELEYHSNGTLTSMGNRTSLGADNGIGIAVMLAILKTKNFKHGPIRCLLTADEEVAMAGAAYLGLTKTGERGLPVQGFKYLLNNDNAFDGEILISTAGAVESTYTIPADPEAKPLDGKTPVYTLEVSGLLGGHSGDWIAKHANAIRIIAETLKEISSKEEFRLIEFLSPGSHFNNVIHTRAFATFTSSLSLDELNTIVEQHLAATKQNFPEETGVKAKLKPAQLPQGAEIKPYSHDISAKIITLLTSLVYGPRSWKNRQIEWIETSGNIGPIFLTIEKKDKVWDQPKFLLNVLDRSCNNDHLQELVKSNKQLAKDCLGADDLDYYKLNALFYGWPGDEDQKLVQTIKNAYEARGVKWTTRNLHGYLEVSWFKHYNKDLVIASIGAEIHNMHDCKETLYTGTLRGVIGATLDCIAQMRWINK